MNPSIAPFQLPLTLEAFKDFSPFTHNLRKLSDLIDHFADKEIVQQILSKEDPLIYEYWEYEYPGTKRGLSFGLTRTLPGRIGGEYFHTKGHFHADGEGDEMYIVLEGQGLLLLYSKDGQEEAIKMVPGTLYYFPGNLAHRTVNIGSNDFIFVSIWPPQINHDYLTVAENGFPKLVMEGADGAILVDNPSFDLYKTRSE